MKAQVCLETTIEPRDLVYYLGLEPALHRRKAKVLSLCTDRVNGHPIMAELKCKNAEIAKNEEKKIVENATEDKLQKFKKFE